MRIKVKCKSYFWGFCREKKADENNNPGYCDNSGCKKFKIEKIDEEEAFFSDDKISKTEPKK